MSSPRWDRVFRDVNLITLGGGAQDWGVIEGGALAVSGGRIAWVGKASDLPARHQATEISCRNAWMTPGFIDCHTHLVYGGNRIGEFEQRLKGATYAEIAAAGGGVLSTVKATRAASESELLQSAARRLKQLGRDGVTTIEIKSGYGLDVAAEMKMLRVAQKLGAVQDVDVIATLLGAHALAPEFAGDRAGYLRLVCDEMIPEAARLGLARAVDCFCEDIAFSAAETEQVFKAAHKHGLPVKLHADQLSDGGGAGLAARFNALSADHLEYASEDGLRAMAATGTVAVLLPGAYYALGETRRPPVAGMRAAGVRMAIASDCNPGSSPVLSLRLMMSMACTLFGLTPLEALQGVTINAAKALGLRDRGCLTPGLCADLALWDISEPGELAYAIGGSLCLGTSRNGRPFPV
jgi:imidazolonepropionase